MNGLTVAERIIVHLGRFIGHCDEYSAPVDVSQNGISQAVRISRAHAAIELKKLKETGLVDEGLAHIKGNRQRRKVYSLTAAGMARAAQIRDFADSEGIDLSTMLDLSRCEPSTFWAGLDEKDRRLFGLACVLRKPFDPALLGEDGLRLVPVDDNGMAFVPANMHDAIPGMMDEDLLRACHSAAADHSLAVKDYGARLHHLIRSGRSREAAMLLQSRADAILDDVEALQDVLSIGPVPERFQPSVLEAKAKAAMRCGKWEMCTSVIAELMGSGNSYTALLLEGEMMGMRGDHEGALGSLLAARDEGAERSVALECRIADSLCELGRTAESLELLRSLLREVSDRPDAILFHLGKALVRHGDAEEAVKCLSKGMSMTSDRDRRAWHRLIGEAYQSAGLLERAAEHFRMAR